MAPSDRLFVRYHNGAGHLGRSDHERVCRVASAELVNETIMMQLNLL